MHFKSFALVVSLVSIGVISCTKTDLRSSSEIAVLEQRASITGAQGVKDYLVLCKTEAVSTNLINRINALGTVRKSLGAIGVVLASSSNSNFEAEIKKLNEVRSVLPDLKMNWLKSTCNLDKVVEMESGSVVGDAVENSASLGLSGTNPLVPLQWSLSSVNAKGAFTTGFKGEGAVVAVLDEGFHINHPDLAANIINTASFVPGEGVQKVNPNAFSHGSHVAGIIAAADDNVGIAGIAPSAKLVLVKVISDFGSGEFGWLIEGVMYAADQGVDIINMSLGAFIPRNGKFVVDDGGTPDDPKDDVVVNEAAEIQDLITALNRAFGYARKKGAVSIASAGNSGIYVTGQGQGTAYPANCIDVIGVAANAPFDWAVNPNTFLFDPSSYTNSGASLVDFGAPGGDFDNPSVAPATVAGITRQAWIFDMVLSCSRASNWGWAAGTSMAAPAAAGVAALIVGKYNGDISPTQLEAKLKNSAVRVDIPNSNHYFGSGQVNAANAVKQ